METKVTYFTNAPRINRTFSDILAVFKELRQTGVSPKMMREHFLKDELLALALWFAEKAETSNGEHTSDMFVDFEEVSHE